ncbi:hypothetical protein [Pseudomonas brassicacearum]|uniref:Iron uptake protein n=1 Tax=Pseudomonas brassicacearum subsp. neoaurantiaca TaxID=494916 RepID=A0A7V8ZUV8_9PSED|nr:hypothetical protein [Pseudomonas brassicacearum]MBA1380523.1 hypothetical protein [Pseudomonas brassicacearum subsp. neoaurantiaca]
MTRRTVKQDKKALDRQRTVWLVLALSIGYLCVWALTTLAGLGLSWLGLQRSEAVLASTIAAFVSYPLLVLWLFCARPARRNGLLVAGASLLALGMAHCLAGGS